MANAHARGQKARLSNAPGLREVPWGSRSRGFRLFELAVQGCAQVLGLGSGSALRRGFWGRNEHRMAVSARYLKLCPGFMGSCRRPDTAIPEGSRRLFPESFSEGFFVKLRRPYNTA